VVINHRLEGVGIGFDSGIGAEFFVGHDCRVVRAEASWQGGYYSMAVDGKLPLQGERLVVLS